MYLTESTYRGCRPWVISSAFREARFYPLQSLANLLLRSRSKVLENLSRHPNQVMLIPERYLDEISNTIRIGSQHKNPHSLLFSLDDAPERPR